MMKLMMRLISLVLPTCEEVPLLASRAMDEDLPWCEPLGLRLHLMVCIWCHRNSGQLETMRDLARCAVHESENRPRLGPSARARIARSLQQENQQEDHDSAKS